jgi:hypothetical protein
VDELARMIGGATVTETVRQSAREMIALTSGGPQGAKAKQKAKGESESRWRRST